MLAIVRSSLVALSLLAVVGCDGTQKPGDTPVDPVDSGNDAVDEDRDGYAAAEDCDDGDGAVNPGAFEICDGVDNDCDDAVDEDVAQAFYADADADGFGDPEAATTACTAPAGHVGSATDCDDADDTVYPGATEVCDGADDDCDGDVDEEGGTLWYADTDGDGFGVGTDVLEACDAPAGYADDPSDCDDADAGVWPGAPEACNEVDDDCDGEVDEEAGLETTYYEDRDEDGYGDPARTVLGCAAPEGYVAAGTDCDDLATDVYPGADETCDGEDDDCDGAVDSGAVDGATWYADADSDGFGDASVSLYACDAPAGWLADARDCDDAAATVNPAAAETCDGVDDDCDGAVDEGAAVGAATWYTDADSDGYGDPGASTAACDAPAGTVPNAADCDDTDATVSPADTETCDGRDEDCDGDVDEASASDAGTWYADRDGDGAGDASTTTAACDAPAGYVATSDDCDDLDATAYVRGTEVCDGGDNDCDGVTDESDAADARRWYADADGDLYGDAGRGLVACDAPALYVADDTDCDDGEAAAHPGAVEVCDGIDNDCDGAADEAGAYGTSDWYTDADGDGYGAGSPTAACDAPAGAVAEASDCDDTDPGTHPGATDYCDGVDDDCDGSETGAVSFVSGTTGAWSDLSATWGAGTAAAPILVSIAAPGTLYVCDGTYYVNLTTSADLTIEGVDGSAATVFDGGGGERVLSSSAGLTLRGVTLRNGYTTAYGGNLYTTGDAALEDVVMVDGSAARGGNLGCSGCTLDLTDVTLEGGSSSLYGGGLYASNATVTGDNVTITDNSSDYGGGIYLLATSDATFMDSTITSNTAVTSGGGIYHGASTSFTITDSTFSGNTSGTYGGAAFVHNATFTMSSSNVQGNSAGTLGGGFYLAGSGAVRCTGTTADTYGIWGNTALLAGGVYLAAATTSITSTTCDWTASSDNTLYDIITSTFTYYSKGNNATFMCTAGSCT